MFADISDYFSRFSEFQLSKPHSLAKARDSRESFCAGTLSVFLPTAKYKRRNLGAFFDVKGADALRAVYLVSAYS